MDEADVRRFAAGRADGRRAALPAFVLPQYAATIARAAQRFNVSGALLAAQLYADTCLLLEA